ncbi:MAG: hypothetical protein NT145_06715 [Elusimicrobia bacterium]|nr:hypothetical protein [Elusimicrobiota bacterium]
MALWLWGGGILFADVPNEIVYQGRLKEYGQPANGSRSMVFEIYPAASGGIASWSSGTQSVSVSSGIFSYILTPNVDWRGKDYWIQLTVNSKILSPREKITAQMYSLHSQTSEGFSEDAGHDITMTIGGSAVGNLSSVGEFKTFSAGTTYYMVPKGFIGMWSGLITDIPSGWHLCDGTGGTPDLTDRFILSVANSSENPGGTGGSHSITLAIGQLPAHSHPFTTNSPGGHSHTANLYGNTGGASTFAYGDGASQSRTALTNSSGDHSHSGTTDSTGSGNTIDIRPAYYKLAFIMKM